MELLSRFELETSSLPIHQTPFCAVPVHVIKYQQVLAAQQLSCYGVPSCPYPVYPVCWKICWKASYQLPQKAGQRQRSIPTRPSQPPKTETTENRTLILCFFSRSQIYCSKKLCPAGPQSNGNSHEGPACHHPPPISGRLSHLASPHSVSISIKNLVYHSLLKLILNIGLWLPFIVCG